MLDQVIIDAVLQYAKDKLDKDIESRQARSGCQHRHVQQADRS